MINKKRTEGKIPSHYGMKDYYKYYKANSEKPVDNKTYCKVIDIFNSELVKLIINEEVSYTPIMLQHIITIRKIKKVPLIKDGKLVNTLPINYKETRQLWDTNPEAKENKILIRYLNTHTSRHVFRIKALKRGNKYKNKVYYLFKPCRAFQRDLAKRILDEDQRSFDAYNLY